MGEKKRAKKPQPTIFLFNLGKTLSINIKGLNNLNLSPNQISQEPQHLLEYGNDWLKQWKGKACLVLFPKSSQDLLNIVQWARQYKHKLVPSGGRTGLSGGAVALHKEIAVSFDKMNQLIDFNPWDRTVTVEAGFITQHLKEFAEKKGLYFPISLASQGSSQIGGNIATNVGGAHVIKYGNIKRYVLGLEVITGCGEILKVGKALVKNAVGYPLKDLFIGSEGTLAFISQATLSLVSPPNNPQVFLIGLEKIDHLLNIFKEFRNEIDPLAFEFWTDKGLKYVLSHGNIRFPLQSRSPFYLLIELEEKDSEKALALFEKFYEKSIVKDGTLSQNPTQAQEIWKLRENISEALSAYKPYKNDISVCASQITDFLKDLEKLLSDHYPNFENIVFGHLGDGNLHINILKPDKLLREDFIKECEKVNKVLFELVKKYEGSISAEHGVGLLKKDYLSYTCSSEEIAVMKGLKKLFDPDNTLNPGKIFNL